MWTLLRKTSSESTRIVSIFLFVLTAIIWLATLKNRFQLYFSALSRICVRYIFSVCFLSFSSWSLMERKSRLTWRTLYLDWNYVAASVLFHWDCCCVFEGFDFRIERNWNRVVYYPVENSSRLVGEGGAGLTTLVFNAYFILARCEYVLATQSENCEKADSTRER